MKELEKIIFSLIIARLDGDKVSDKSYLEQIERLLNDGIGGFVLFGGQYEEIKKFLFSIHNKTSKPLIIASDIERGVGQQIKHGTLIPSQMGIAAGFDIQKDKSDLKALYSIVVNEALDLGINLALIPVLDVNTEKENPIICTRAFSDNPEIVSEFGKFVIKTFKSYGLATCGKHFPGHGSTKIDSHLALPLGPEDINLHLKPFDKAIREGVPTIMVGHLLLPQLDTKPSTLSDKIINRLLKRDLAFKGLVLTDAMNMKALKDYSYPNALALKAGADIILHPDDPYDALKEIVNAFKKGLINEKLIQEAAKRVDGFRIKLKNQIIRPQPITNKNFTVNRAFKKTITLLKNELNGLNSKKIIPYLSGSYSEDLKKIFENQFGSAFDIKNFKLTDSISLIAIFTNVKAAGKEYEIRPEENAMINNIISKQDTILISFGNPYVIRNLSIKKAKTVALIYDSNEPAVRAFLDLFDEGLNTPKKPPIKIDFANE